MLNASLNVMQLAVACEDRVLRVFRVEDVGTKHFNFKRRELVRDLVDVAFGAGGDLFVLSKVRLHTQHSVCLCCSL